MLGARSDPHSGPRREPATTLAAMDAATRWETEAIRQARRPRPSQQRETTDWATLREASDATGVPVGTVRSWAKSGAVRSYLESDGEMSLRMVDLDAVRRRADHRAEDTEPEATEPEAREPETAEEPPTPPDTMIVPIDAWNKMLMQLGNLHEAGQQLAEARERAAKAETEAEFLRAQLKEMRDRRTEPSAEDQETAHARSEDEPSTEPKSTSFVRYIYRGWRSRRSRS